MSHLRGFGLILVGLIAGVAAALAAPGAEFASTKEGIVGT
jgi:hypothetical protein